MARIVVDTGVWIAICDKRDNTVAANIIEDIYQRIQAHTIIIPWPVAYETLRTRFARNAAALRRFESELKSTRISMVDDSPYRDDALALTVSFVTARKQTDEYGGLSFAALHFRRKYKDTISIHVQRGRLQRRMPKAQCRALVGQAAVNSHHDRGLLAMSGSIVFSQRRRACGLSTSTAPTIRMPL